MDQGIILKPAKRMLSQPPTPPPPSPTLNRPSMSNATERPRGGDTPSDDEIRTFGSPSLCEPGPSNQNGARSEPKEDCSRPTLRQKLIPLLKRCNPSLTLENSGSVARDHLASERTFLAYVRTSLTIASTGVGAF